jgi:hypothetical protein
MVFAATCGEIWWCYIAFGVVKKEGSFYSYTKYANSECCARFSHAIN